MKYSKRLERLRKFISEGRLLREEWMGRDQAGRETGCLLAALSPEAGKAGSSVECPAEVMPEWFARLTPWIDDLGSKEHWPEVVRRYADLAGRWPVLSERDWELLDYRVRAICVRAALRNAGKVSEQTQVICGRAIELCERAGHGAQIDNQEWGHDWSIKDVARVAAIAVQNKTHSVVDAVGAIISEASIEGSVFAEAAADRLIDQILDELERTIEEKEAHN